MRSVLRSAQVTYDMADPVVQLRVSLGATPLAMLCLFVTPRADFRAIVDAAQQAFPKTEVMACTTAGEIGVRGYEDDQIVAIGFPEGEFAVTSLLIEDLDALDEQALIDTVIQARIAQKDEHPEMAAGFAFMVIDGLSLREDLLANTLSHAMGGLPLFGGSAGDGVDFEQTRVALNAQCRKNAAVLTLLRTVHDIEVFCIDHLIPTEQRMVVTQADPDRRIVKEINAAPAAREYARMVGKNPDELDQFTFASHPVVVRIGGSHHVRAIQQVNDDGELIFFSAIDEGMVLRVANSREMASHLDEALTDLAHDRAPNDIIGCDCMLRRLEAEQLQKTHDVSAVLSEHRVRGFSTYGEQFGPLHVNHTMTGVAIYDRTTDD